MGCDEVLVGAVLFFFTVVMASFVFFKRLFCGKKRPEERLKSQEELREERAEEVRLRLARIKWEEEKLQENTGTFYKIVRHKNNCLSWRTGHLGDCSCADEIGVFYVDDSGVLDK